MLYDQMEEDLCIDVFDIFLQSWTLQQCHIGRLQVQMKQSDNCWVDLVPSLSPQDQL